ncbi:hypothetical protein KIPB_010210, partial [Kipferlia bialata]
DSDMAWEGDLCVTEPRTGARVPVLFACVCNQQVVPLVGTVRDPISGATVPLLPGQPAYDSSVFSESERLALKEEREAAGEDGIDMESIASIGITLGISIDPAQLTALTTNANDLTFGSPFRCPSTGTKAIVGTNTVSVEDSGRESRQGEREGQSVPALSANDLRLSSLELTAEAHFLECCRRDAEILTSVGRRLVTYERETNELLQSGTPLEEQATWLAEKQEQCSRFHEQMARFTSDRDEDEDTLQAYDWLGLTRVRAKEPWVEVSSRIAHSMSECEAIIRTGACPATILGLSLTHRIPQQSVCGLDADGLEAQEDIPSEENTQFCGRRLQAEDHAYDQYSQRVEGLLARIGSVTAELASIDPTKGVENHKATIKTGSALNEAASNLTGLSSDLTALLSAEKERAAAAKADAANAPPLLRRVLHTQSVSPESVLVASVLDRVTDLADTVRQAAEDVLAAEADSKQTKKAGKALAALHSTVTEVCIRERTAHSLSLDE